MNRDRGVLHFYFVCIGAIGARTYKEYIAVKQEHMGAPATSPHISS